MASQLQVDEYVRFITGCPEWFVYEFYNRVIGAVDRDVEMPLTHCRLVMLEDRMRDSILLRFGPGFLPTTKARLLKGFRFKMAWIRRHPGSTNEDGDDMMLLVTEGQQLPGFEVTCHWRMDLLGPLHLLQWYRIDTDHSSFPAAVYELHKFPVGPPSLRLNKFMRREAKAIRRALLPHMPMMGRNPVIGWADFESDEEGNAIQAFMNIVEGGDKTEVGSDIAPLSEDDDGDGSDVVSDGIPSSGDRPSDHEDGGEEVEEFIKLDELD